MILNDILFCSCVAERRLYCFTMDVMVIFIHLNHILKTMVHGVIGVIILFKFKLKYISYNSVLKIVEAMSGGMCVSVSD